VGRARGRPSPGPPLDLLVVGHTNVDHFLKVARLPRVDRTVPLTSERTALGGTAATIARWAARAGVATGLHSLIGPDFPRSFERTMASEGVDIGGVRRVEGARTPSCYIVEDGRGAQFTLIHQGPMGNADGASVPVTLVARSRWVHLTTGDPRYLLKVKAVAQRAGVKVAVDPAQEIHYLWDAGTFASLIEGAEVLFGNHDEVERSLTLLRIPHRRALLARVPLVVETRGRSGAIAWTRRGPIRTRAVRPRRMRQVTGAGDAFRGGFYGAWFAGQPLPGCLQFAAASAARCIEGRTEVKAPSLVGREPRP